MRFTISSVSQNKVYINLLTNMARYEAPATRTSFCWLSNNFVFLHSILLGIAAISGLRGSCFSPVEFKTMASLLSPMRGGGTGEPISNQYPILQLLVRSSICPHVLPSPMLSFWFRMVSMAMAVFPVCRSPIMSSRWPRPIGIRLSTALRPVVLTVDANKNK